MRFCNPDLEWRIKQGEKIALELGSGSKREHKTRYALDLHPLDGVDIVADLNGKLDLIPDKCVTELYTRHTLEHVDNLVGLMEEIQRICVPGASITVIVPHFSNPLAHSDPTHVRLFGIHTMFYFSDTSRQPSRKVPTHYSTARFLVKDIGIRFYRNGWVDKTVAPFVERMVNLNWSTRTFYERYLAYVFPAWEIQFALVTES
jgi:hypothetical protein